MKKDNDGKPEIVVGTSLGIVAILQALLGGAVGCGVSACAAGVTISSICPVCALVAAAFISLGIYKKHEKKKD